jgi:hypothetical protein
MWPAANRPAARADSGMITLFGKCARSNSRAARTVPAIWPNDDRIVVASGLEVSAASIGIKTPCPSTTSRNLLHGRFRPVGKRRHDVVDKRLRMHDVVTPGHGCLPLAAMPPVDVWWRCLEYGRPIAAAIARVAGCGSLDGLPAAR